MSHINFFENINFLRSLNYLVLYRKNIYILKKRRTYK